MAGTKKPQHRAYAKMTEDIVREARRQHRAGASIVDIARVLRPEYGISYYGIRDMVNGHTWAHIEDEDESESEA